MNSYNNNIEDLVKNAVAKERRIRNHMLFYTLLPVIIAATLVFLTSFCITQSIEEVTATKQTLIQLQKNENEINNELEEVVAAYREALMV